MRKRPVVRVLEARPHLVLPSRLDPAGLTGPTEAQARGPHYRWSSWGHYVPTEVPFTTEQRILEAGFLLPEYGGVTGWASLFWQGATRWFDGTMSDGSARPVWLAVGGDDIRAQRGVKISAERLAPADLVVVDDLRLTSAVRSTCFEMRYAPSDRKAAEILSMVAYHDLVSIEELAEYAAAHSGWTGIPRCRAALALAEENCWSPTEFTMIWTWRVPAGLPRARCNQPVFGLDGRHIGTPDLLDVEAGVVGQYHGTLHLAGSQARVDLLAEEAFRNVGLECFTMMAPDLTRTDLMVERMHAARARARWEAESTRQWTIEPPPWWIPTDTVERRRALDADQRRRMLRYRSA